MPKPDIAPSKPTIVSYEHNGQKFRIALYPDGRRVVEGLSKNIDGLEHWGYPTAAYLSVDAVLAKLVIKNFEGQHVDAGAIDFA